MATVKKTGTGSDGAPETPQVVCPMCRTTNDANSSLCKRCGDVLPKKKKSAKSGEKEFDATEGSFSPTCIVAPILLILVGIVFLFFCFKGGAKPGTCDYNIGKIQAAVFKYNKKHHDSKMHSLDFNLLTKPDANGKAFLKEQPNCPVNQGAKYEMNPDNEIICSHCSRK